MNGRQFAFVALFAAALSAGVRAQDTTRADVKSQTREAVKSGQVVSDDRAMGASQAQPTRKVGKTPTGGLTRAEVKAQTASDKKAAGLKSGDIDHSPIASPDASSAPRSYRHLFRKKKAAAASSVQ